MELTGSEKKHLRGLAHSVKPTAFIGKNGITQEVLDAVEIALNAHELIKIKFTDYKEDRKPLSAEVAEKSQSVLCGVIGNNAILYRRHSDPEKRKIKLS